MSKKNKKKNVTETAVDTAVDTSAVAAVVEMPANIEVPRELPVTIDADSASNPYKALINELNRAFHHFNKELANGELKTPIINVLPRGRKKAYGWYFNESWAQGEARLNEICICAETLDRELDQVLETLIHEMAHLSNAQKGIKDCNAIQYHNREFKKAAEALGLIVERVQGKGFAKTVLGERAKAAIESLNVNKEAFTVKRMVHKTTYKKVNYVVVDDEVKDKIKQLATKQDVSEREVMNMIFSGLISLTDMAVEEVTEGDIA